jgi:L-ascorbate metabolism protein UlaG (beta-lactamase superfamily)
VATDVSTIRLTHLGGPTTLIEVGGWRILTDPTFDDPGRTYRFGWGTSSRKTTGPAIPAAEIGPIDVVLLTHDHHADNLDDAGRDLLPLAGTVITTVRGARRLANDAVGLHDWESSSVADPSALKLPDGPQRAPITITATPCRHGPPGSRPIVGDVIGFALTWDDQRYGALWISGDTVLYDGVLEVASRFAVGTAVVHLGRVRFPITGPVRYSMDIDDAIELCAHIRPTTIVPVHFDGWSHFSQGRDAIAERLTHAPPDITDRFRWAPLGTAIEIDT